MATVLLGPTEATAVLLPPIRWVNGAAPELPIDYSRVAPASRLLSGRQKFHPRPKTPRRWVLEWEMLTAAELTALITLNEYDQGLYFLNDWDEEEATEAVVTAFEYNPVLNVGPVGCRWGVSMTLEEVV